MLGSRVRWNWLAVGAAALLEAGSLAGCRLLIDDAISQCNQDADCEALLGPGHACTAAKVCEVTSGEGESENDASMDGEVLPPEWACLAEEPAPESNGDAPLHLRIAFYHYGTFALPEGLQVKACNAWDVMCDEPLFETSTVDEDGFVEIEVPAGFMGYLEATGPDMVDSLFFRNTPYTDGAEFDAPAVIMPAVQRALAAGGGEEVDPNQGVVILDAVDCNGDAPAGVSFVQVDSESQERPFYFQDELPDRDQPGTEPSSALTRDTSLRAVGGFSQVERGYVTIHGRLLEPDLEVGQISVIVRADSITYAHITAGHR